MPKVTCKTCGDLFEQGRGLSNHQRKCIGLKQLHKETLKRRTEAVRALRKREKKHRKEALLNQQAEHKDHEPEPTNEELEEDAEMFMHPEGDVEPDVAPEHESQLQPDNQDLDVNSQTGRPKRQRFLPAAFRDFIPSQPSTLSSTIPTRTRYGSTPPAIDPISPKPESRSPSFEPPPEPTMRCTEPDIFGLFREYTEFPSYEPDNHISLDEICDAATFNIPPSGPQVVFSSSQNYI